MSERFHDKYRIPSARLQNWDYGWNAPYFITICTQNRKSYFGDIVKTPKLGVVTESSMILSEIGKIAEQYWNEIPRHFPFVELGEFVVMPNHVHGIIIIDKPNNDAMPTAASEKWNSGKLGVIINQYKRFCTLNARKIYSDFGWQSRFHEHIIRTDDSFQRISEYIRNNPLKWNDDKFCNGMEP